MYTSVRSRISPREMATPRGIQSIIWPNIPENYIKTEKYGPRWGEGRVYKFCLRRSITVDDLSLKQISYYCTHVFTMILILLLSVRLIKYCEIEEFTCCIFYNGPLILLKHRMYIYVSFELFNDSTEYSI